MKINSIDFSKLDYILHCPYCNKVIFSIGDQDIQDRCEHLLFIYDDYENQFAEDQVDEVIKIAYEEAIKMADEDEGLAFDDFLSQFDFKDKTIESIGIFIYDETSEACGGLWFGFKSS